MVVLVCLVDDVFVILVVIVVDDVKVFKDKNIVSDFFIVFMFIFVKIKMVIFILNNCYNIGKVYYVKVKINKD